MSKKISKAIRDSEEYLAKMKKDLPIELNGIIDFLLKAATIDIDEDFFDKTFFNVFVA